MNTRSMAFAQATDSLVDNAPVRYKETTIPVGGRRRMTTTGGEIAEAEAVAKRDAAEDSIVYQSWNALPPPDETIVIEPMYAEDEPVEYTEEMAWLDRHGEELAPYRGQWVALVGSRIIAHAASVAVVMARAKESGHDRPFLIPVPPEGVLAV